MRVERARLSRVSEVARAMDYMLDRWPSFSRLLDDGCVCMTTDGVKKPQSSSGDRFFWLLLPGRDHTLVRLLGPRHVAGLAISDLSLIQ